MHYEQPSGIGPATGLLAEGTEIEGRTRRVGGIRHDGMTRFVGRTRHDGTTRLLQRICTASATPGSDPLDRAASDRAAIPSANVETAGVGT